MLHFSVSSASGQAACTVARICSRIGRANSADLAIYASMRGSWLLMALYSQLADKELVATEMPGAAHRPAQRGEAAAAVERLRRVHAGERFQIAALESMCAGRVQAALHHGAAGADAARGIG